MYSINIPSEFKRFDYPPLYKAPRPNFENPVHDWSHNMPCCVVRENLQQQNHCNTFIICLTLHLSPRAATTSLKCSLPWIDKHWTCYLFSFCLDPKEHHHMILVHIVWTVLWKVHFVKFYSFMLPTPGLPSADMQLRPFHLSLGPGVMRDILSKFWTSQLCRNYPEISWINSNSGHSWRHGQTWLIGSQYPTFKTYLNVALWSLIPTFLGWKVTPLPNIYWKCKSFLKISSPKNFSEMLQVRETGFLALLPTLRPRASVVLRFHRSAFQKQELCSLDFAVAGCPVERRQTSGAFPETPRRRRKLNKAELCTGSTDKRTMNVSDSTSSKLFKAKYIHKRVGDQKINRDQKN